MRRLPNRFLACISLLLLCSCAKGPFSNGSSDTREGKVDEKFRVLVAKDNVDVSLQQANETHPAGSYLVSAGDNIIDKILVEQSSHQTDSGTVFSDTVVIHNDNRFNWLRPYDTEIKVTLYYDSIREVVFNSNGNLHSDVLHGILEPITQSTVNNEGDTIVENTRLYHLYVNVTGGSGDLNLRVQCDRLSTNYIFGTACVNLKGRSPIAYTYTSYNSHGPTDARDLWTNYHYIYHYGTNIVYAFAKHQIDANIYNNGIIRYRKDPNGAYPEVPLNDSLPNIEPIYD